MPFFERYLSVWVALAIVAGVTLGVAMPGAFEAVAGFEYAHVNLAV
jgi:ACR3 family arsenite transporter